MLFAPKELPSWNQIALRYAEYTGYFLIYGALGFQWLARRSCRDVADPEKPSPFARICHSALRRAASVGVAGSVVLATELVISGAKKATHGGSFLAVAGPKILIQLAFAFVALLAFGLAARGISRAWILAWIAGAGFVLRNTAAHKWSGPVNPLHEAGAALWLGTLLMILVVGLPLILRSGSGNAQTFDTLKRLIQRFSPIALTGACLMLVTGTIAAWTHIKTWVALWTTSYGLTLCGKLAVVLAVTALGAWNWRRVAPAIDTAQSTREIRRTSTMELLFGAIVLFITAILVLLPNS